MTQPDLATWLQRKPAGPKPKRPLPRVTKKRAKQLREYSKRRKAFLEAHPICQVWLKENSVTETTVSVAMLLLIYPQAPRSTEVHHRGKRRGEALLDESLWLACCQKNHERIEQNKSWARANGFLLNF